MASSPSTIPRGDFPKGFIFGTGSSAFQVEGAANAGGRGRSIWDTFCEKKAARSKIESEKKGWLGFRKGNDHYHRLQEDVKLLKKMGVNSYRFSLSWSRILPDGRVGIDRVGVNKEGVDFYNNLINALKARDIEPFVTLFHWDLPQMLEDEYGGFLHEKIREDFKNYADFCFEEFGDRVKHWSTLNEPQMFATRGYGTGDMAPGRGYPLINPEDGKVQVFHHKFGELDGHFNREEDLDYDIAKMIYDPAVEPYIVGHNLILSHVAAYNLYHTKYEDQNGEVGITLNSFWFVEEKESDKDAAKRRLDFMLGWFMQPLTTGKYPDVMKNKCTDRLPTFNVGELIKPLDKKFLFDFVGVNYYTSVQVTDKTSDQKSKDQHFATDHHTMGAPYGKDTAHTWVRTHAEGLQHLLKAIKEYDSGVKQDIGSGIAIYVTENGIFREKSKKEDISVDHHLKDDIRIDYIKDHLFYAYQAIKLDKVNVKGYYTWSFLDSFEWSHERARFGHYYVDFEAGCRRIPKDSVKWYTSFLENKKTQSPEDNVQVNSTSK